MHPYSLAFPDARTILVSEQPGRLRVIRDGVLLPKPAWEAAAGAAGGARNGGERLHFIALHPAFERNHLVYLSYPKYGPTGSTMAVGRGTLDGRHAHRTSRSSSWPRPGTRLAPIPGR